MRQDDLIAKIAESSKQNKALTKIFLKSLVKVISRELKHGESIRIHHFGIFKVIKTKERTGINPQTGKKIKIASKKVPKFKFSSTIKDLVKK